jgi:hypothetical protein
LLEISTRAQADIVWGNPSTGDNGLWLMDGGALKAAQPIPSASTSLTIIE